MQPEDSSGPSLSRTTLDPEQETVTLGAWVAPLKCEGCGGRVDTFYRYNRPDDARCGGCGSEWTVESV